VPGFTVVGSDFSRAAAMVERLCFSLPVMLEFGAPIYLSESKSVLRFSRKRKDAQLKKTLIVVKSLATITTTFSVGSSFFASNGDRGS
jgi:hypothetical protein